MRSDASVAPEAFAIPNGTFADVVRKIEVQPIDTDPFPHISDAEMSEYVVERLGSSASKSSDDEDETVAPS